MEAFGPPGVRFSMEQVGDDLVLRRRTGSFAAAVFLLAWQAVWTVACVALVIRAVRDPTLEHAMFAVPFLVAWLVVFVFLLQVTIGFERLRVGSLGLEHSTLAGRRRVPLAEVKGISHCWEIIKDEDGERTRHSLVVETLGRPIPIGAGLDEQGRRWLADRLLDHLGALAPTRSFGHHTGETSKPEVQVEVLGDDGPIPGPPSDCSLRLHADGDRAEFVKRGTIRLKVLGGITCATLFWNGGVGVFVINLMEHFDWGSFLFLIPFLAVGVGLFAFWLLALLSPLWVERWKIGPREVSARWSLLGLGRIRRSNFEEIGQVELRRDAPEPGKVGDEPYSVAFASIDGRDLIVLSSLTEGEGRWVGGIASERLKGWLPKGRSRSSPVRDDQAVLWDHELDG